MENGLTSSMLITMSRFSNLFKIPHEVEYPGVSYVIWDIGPLPRYCDFGRSLRATIVNAS